MLTERETRLILKYIELARAMTLDEYVIFKKTIEIILEEDVDWQKGIM